MRLMIDNLDGRGPAEYSDWLMAEEPLTIERRLNEPSTCRWMLRDATPRPARLARVVVTAEDGTVLFTGYLPQEPQLAYAGEGAAGAVYRLQLEAISDEWLLDRQGLQVGGENFAESGDALLASLTSRVGGGRFTTASAGEILQVGSVRTSAAESWSANAKAIANAAGASYRVIGGEVMMAPLGAVVHTLNVADDTLTERGLTLRTGRPPANDITISGAVEAGAYVTEMFVGDGTTSDFALSSTPYTGGSSNSRTIVRDSFLTGVIDRQRWGGGDPGSHLSVGAGGLLLSGGNGLDGQTTLAALSGVEPGGVVLLEAAGVVLAQGSDGVLLGLYNGAVSRGNCMAGFDVRQGNGTTTVGCLVNGVVAGTTVPLATGHRYSLRLHLHATEAQRVRQSYVVMVDGVQQQFGGGLVEAPLDVVFELVDLGSASNTPATVLFDGRIASSPASVSFVPVNSVQLLGSIQEIVAERLQGPWVKGTTSAGAAVTRLPGATGTGADYATAGAGMLRFFPGRVPAAGELVTVRYRTKQRAVARVQDAASVASEAASGLPGIATWQGSVLEPQPRSAEDCSAAAEALLLVATRRAEAMTGSYDGENLPDVWPGDLLQSVTATGTYLLTVRRVVLKDGVAAPELIRSSLVMANDWAESASIRVSTTLAADAGNVPAGGGSSTVPGLGGLQVVSVTKAVVQVDTGVPALSGGGFEVRRSEGGFGPGQSADLVLRSSVRGFSIPRGAQVERFYVRPYDGSTPPIYSRLSSVIVLNVPVG